MIAWVSQCMAAFRWAPSEFEEMAVDDLRMYADWARGRLK